MLKILEFVEVGEYETAWSLAVANKKQESLEKIVFDLGQNMIKAQIEIADLHKFFRQFMPDHKYCDYHHQIRMIDARTICKKSLHEKRDISENYRMAWMKFQELKLSNE